MPKINRVRTPNRHFDRLWIHDSAKTDTTDHTEVQTINAVENTNLKLNVVITTLSQSNIFLMGARMTRSFSVSISYCLLFIWVDQIWSHDDKIAGRE